MLYERVRKEEDVKTIIEMAQKLEGIRDLRDESNKEGVRIVIELKKDAYPQKILNQLYKLTPLQTSFGYNMIALTERGKNVAARLNAS